MKETGKQCLHKIHIVYCIFSNYTQPLQRNLWYGNDTKYVVTIDDGETIWNQSFCANTVTVELNRLFAANGSCQLTVQTQNEIGITKQSAELNIASFAENSQL